MDDSKMMTVQEALSRIPLTARPSVLVWLEAWAALAAQTARRIRLANKATKDPAIEASAKYWANVNSACNTLAAQLEQANEIPDRAPGGEKYVDSNPGR